MLRAQNLVKYRYRCTIWYYLSLSIDVGEVVAGLLIPHSDPDPGCQDDLNALLAI
jgi:hypothetical protein